MSFLLQMAAVLATLPILETPPTQPAVERTRLHILDNCEPGREVEVTLVPGEAARLGVAPNRAGLTSVLMEYEADRLKVTFGFTDDEITSTYLSAKRLRDQRIVSTKNAPEWMECTTQWTVDDTSARIRFRPVTISAEKVRQFKDDQAKRMEARLDKLRRKLEWDDTELFPVEIAIPQPTDPRLSELRRRHQLDKLVAGAVDEYEKLRRLVKWTHDRWKHRGDNTPSRSDPLTILAEAAEGKRFRCVEYACVTTACAQALGLPARRLALKREDVETAQSGAGHVVSEVWLPSLGKWVFVDPQWDAIPEMKGKPLNAVEFQEAIASKAPELVIRSSSGAEPASYLRWIAAYLYYFDFNLDQDQFGADQSEDGRRRPARGGVILVPKGARKPTVFQRNHRLRNYTYVSNPRAFYPRLDSATSCPEKDQQTWGDHIDARDTAGDRQSR